MLFIAIFAYPNQNIKKIHEAKLKIKVERETKIKKEIERAKTGKAEEMGNDNYKDSDYESYNRDGG